LNISLIDECLNVYPVHLTLDRGSCVFRFAVLMLEVMEEIQRRASEIKWPFFILHGSADKLGRLEGSQLLCDRASSKVKTLKVISYRF